VRPLTAATCGRQLTSHPRQREHPDVGWAGRAVSNSSGGRAGAKRREKLPPRPQARRARVCAPIIRKQTGEPHENRETLVRSHAAHRHRLRLDGRAVDPFGKRFSRPSDRHKPFPHDDEEESDGDGAKRFGRRLRGLGSEERRLFREGREAFEEEEDAADGLGPIFNHVGCAACHFAPAVGGSSGINETRAARVVSGVYTELPGGSLFQSDAIDPDCRENIPPEANVIAQRQTQPLFGSGLIEAIPDEQIEAYAALQSRAFPEQAGRVNHIVDPASRMTRVGRFGWKAQQASLLAFSADAYVNEMGITSRLFPEENAPNGDQTKLAACDAVRDPEDLNDDITLFTNFMRLLAPPPRSDMPWKERGRRVFERVGCAVCHRAGSGGFTAESESAALNGRRVDALSDFLLHDVGTGDGIVQGDAQGNELRTAPLWGLSASAPYLHDGSAATIGEAILRHGNQGAAAQAAFQALSYGERQALLEFLDSI